MKDGRTRVTDVIHEYFPILLSIAATNHIELGNATPLEWTLGHMHARLGAFLAMDTATEKECECRYDSRILRSVERITTGNGWLSECASMDFRLPRWVDIPALDGLRCFRTAEDRAAHYTQHDGECLSRKRTLGWVEGNEFFLRMKIQKQMNREIHDGVIEAGKTGISVHESGPARSTAETEAREPKISVRIVDGTRMLDVSKEKCAVVINRAYPILCEAVERARAWVRVRRPNVSSPEMIRYYFPDLGIAADDEIDRDVIRNPFRQTTRQFVLELLKTHTPRNLSSKSIARYSGSLK